MHKDYEKLLDVLKKTKILESITHLLDWDQETMMPKQGVEIRAKQNAELSFIIHQKKTAKSFENLLAKCISISTGKIKSKNLDPRHQANLQLIREDFIKAKRLPNKFVKDLAELRSLSTQVWAKAKEENKFEDFAPYLEKVIQATRKQADYLQYDHHPYDALLDLYEPKMTTKVVDQLFGTLKSPLLDLTKKLSKQSKPSTAILEQPVDADKQLAFCRSVVEQLGLSQEVGRLDTSSHPFCNSISSQDVRLTTKIHPNAYYNAISSTLHETGHGLYEAGLPKEDFGSPLGESCSLGVHESQSRLFETFIGQGKPFVRYLSKRLKGVVLNHDENELYQAINVVEPSFIRIESDEVTYCLHIMLRYELEKDLIEGKLKVKDLKEAWNEKMQKYLGITPPTDTLGCLQDIHWSMGLIGYFPTYALGNLYAAQLFLEMKTQIKEFDGLVASGEFLPIVEWLHQKIYRFGREKSPQDLIQAATKKQLSCDAYVSYLKEKYI
jgi:carboxypeptidase Taq